MSKKVYMLTIGLIGAAVSATEALLSYFQPGNTPAIIAAVGIGSTAIYEILNLFVKTDQLTKSK